MKYKSVKGLLTNDESLIPTNLIDKLEDLLHGFLGIMRTVIVRFTDGIFQLENFLIIGVIAAVRHILTVGASLTMQEEKTDQYFNRALIEMGVNTGIVLALVFGLFLARAARKPDKSR